MFDKDLSLDESILVICSHCNKQLKMNNLQFIDRRTFSKCYHCNGVISFIFDLNSKEISH